ncbi:hypothetical protein C7M84_013418 [Penaeus vannamei]|uniref:Uncharacterized protein n=1 Tax=Penaeus vannamei TaxID=6689 RepID=A0A3R7Q4L2_PENVA|nr:hypothetical protein C7M84_013418 [Penaeus vannamei]
MRPGSLHRACGWRIARSLITAVWQLSIIEVDERNHLISVLKWFIEQYGEVLFSRVMQDQLYKNLISGLRSRHNPPIYLTSMLVLCPKIAVIEDHNGLPPPVAGTGLDITSEECRAILDVLSDLRQGWNGSKSLPFARQNGESYHLPTKTLVLEGVYFHDPDFLPLLFREMPDLRHIELQYNGTPSVLLALSAHCPKLESLCFLEPRMEVTVLEKDIWPILFGIPSPSDPRNPSGILTRFAQEKDFRDKFVLQFPNLKKLDLDELYFEEEVLHDVYILALVLQPQLSSFGKHTGLTRRILSKFRQLWNVKNNRSDSHIDLYLSKAKFVDSVCDVPNDAELELRYLEEIVPMFKMLKSVELQKGYWTESEVARFCRIFADRVDAFSLSDLPINEISCLSSVTHLRLTFMRQYSFEQVHFILDHCPNLQTLSIHPVFQEHPHVGWEGAMPLHRFGQMMDEDRQILENLLIDELVEEMEDLQVFLGEGGDEQAGGNVLRAPNFPGAMGEGAQLPPAGPRPPAPLHERLSKSKYTVHQKLVTLRIASLFEATKEPSEAFLSSLLERLPNLRNLCLGMWMGALSHRRNHLTCTGNALVNVVTSSQNSKPLLANLEQLCCLPSGTEQTMCLSLARLADALPSLRTLVVPALDTFLLTPTLRFFQHTSIDIQHKCATDQVFSHWEPEH